MTPAGGWDISKAEPKSGGRVQLATRLKSTVPPANSAPAKPTVPPENSAPAKSTVSLENSAREKLTVPPALVSGRRYQGIVRPLREVGSLLDANAMHPGRTGWFHLLSVAQSNGIARQRVTEVLRLTGLDNVARKRVKGALVD